MTLTQTDALAALTDALRGEVSVLRELTDAIHRQRAAVAVNDTTLVQATIGDVGRLLAALAEGRRERTHIIDVLTGNAQSTLDDVEACFPDQMSDDFALVRADLRRAAHVAAQDVALNHRILEKVVSDGEVFLQHLFASAAGSPDVYHAPESSQTHSSGASVLLNRVA